MTCICDLSQSTWAGKCHSLLTLASFQAYPRLLLFDLHWQFYTLKHRAANVNTNWRTNNRVGQERGYPHSAKLGCTPKWQRGHAMEQLHLQLGHVLNALCCSTVWHVTFEILPYWANPLNSWAMNIVFSAVVMTPASKHTYLLIMNAILHVYMYVVSGNVVVPCRQSSGIMKTGSIHSCMYMDLPSNLTPRPLFSFWHLFLVGSVFLRRRIRPRRN